ncbi:hypothetical protein V7266_25345, partial [Neobacillus drentensis]|uniref:hypothetical protein n=1 Tax=Neobacillus drentensis TaxID=220684 RepID=UPI002FFF9314
MKGKLLTILSIVVLLMITGCSKSTEQKQGAESDSPKIANVELKKIDNSTIKVTSSAEGQELVYA